MSSDTNDYRPYRGEAYYEPHRVRVKEDKDGHVSFDSDGGVDYGTAHMGPTSQSMFRRMSDYPDQPRKFSDRNIAFPITIVCIPLMCFVLWANIAYYDPADPNHNRDSIIIPAGLLVICLLFFLYGVFFRTGVDWEKVWWRFGPFYYKEVRFDEVTRFETPEQRYKLFAGEKSIRINYVHYDFTLVLIRLLVELDRRKFMIREVGVDNLAWEDKAQIFRKIFANFIRADHWNYYVRFPDELERIRTLAHLPAEWTAPVDEERRRLGIQVAGKPDGEGA
ncbi:hypothetical protein HMPREF3198_01665 [Winkia neuii]|uniref:Uncharacterized protein n=1 Tax=Winkia neuii TaxID=33007 RepID=A0A2I1ILG9_9ACTO|nr:hypothetical protein [Winkia neuii]KWZ72782.1 hypothetical protein HMPREF3198_01665 [Winkia neuii]MDK8100746.1 hypothetical protein [Winkia neuii]PKY71966.1 hypothetical protein CYJ19_07060 [Winkia neuii]